MRQIWIMKNGLILPCEKATISVMDYGFLYGDSVYEVMKSVEGKLFAAELHLQRLRYSAEKLGLPVPWEDGKIKAELNELANQIAVPWVYLRLVLTRGTGPFFFDPEHCEAPVRLVYGTEFIPFPPELYSRGVDLMISEFRKGPSRHDSGSVKTGNYMDHVLPRYRAQEKGFHEALMLNHAGAVTECTSANIFWFSRGELFTPDLSMGILNGVTRQLVLLAAERVGIRVQEGSFALEKLGDADEVFITSTTRDILPVRSIGEFRFRPGLDTERLMKQFLETGLG